jgi:tetratricopeptide (TPR) repeat protein
MDEVQFLTQNCIGYFSFQGKHSHALKFMEQSLVLLHNFFGAESEEVAEARLVIGKTCNIVAKQHLSEDRQHLEMIGIVLKKAEICLEHHPTDLAVTYNNTACLLRKSNQSFNALIFTEKALRLEQVIKERKSRNKEFFSSADTHLNHCALLSQIGNHKLALEHAETAVLELRAELYDFDGEFGEKNEDQPHNNIAQRRRRFSVLAVAYFNCGVEQEHCRIYPDCIDSYKESVGIAQHHLGRNHATTQKLERELCGAEQNFKRRNKHLQSAKA